MNVFSQTQKLNEDGSALLAGSNENVTDPQILIVDLQRSIEGLEMQLPLLYQQVSGPFLDEQKISGH